MLPWIAPPRSVRMSANRLLATTTSRDSGWVTNRAAIASTKYRCVAIAGYSRATSSKTSSQKTAENCIAFDLVTLWTLFRPRVTAYSKA